MLCRIEWMSCLKSCHDLSSFNFDLSVVSYRAQWETSWLLLPLFCLEAKRTDNAWRLTALVACLSRLPWNVWENPFCYAMAITAWSDNLMRLANSKSKLLKDRWQWSSARKAKKVWPPAVGQIWPAFKLQLLPGAALSEHCGMQRHSENFFFLGAGHTLDCEWGGRGREAGHMLTQKFQQGEHEPGVPLPGYATCPTTLSWWNSYEKKKGETVFSPVPSH